MFAIGMEIEKVVENIESGGTKAVEYEANESADNGFDREVMRQCERQKEQKIFRPVMAAEGVDPGAERGAERRAEGCLRFENRYFERSYSCGLLGAGFGAHHVSCASVTPNFHIGGRVA